MAPGRRRASTVLVAARRLRTRERIAAELEKARFRVVGSCSTGAEAVAVARRSRPELCVLEDGISGGGTTVTRALRALPQPPHVLILSASQRPDDVLAGLRAGANGWVVEEIDPSGLPGCARAVTEGGTVLPPELVSALVDELRLLSTSR